jgi:hypothetical protein
VVKRDWVGRDGYVVEVNDVVETLGGVVSRIVRIDADGYALLHGQVSTRYAPHLAQRAMPAADRAAALALVARLRAEVDAAPRAEKAERGRAGWQLLKGLPERVPVRDAELGRALSALLERYVYANAHVDPSYRAVAASVDVLAAARPLVVASGYAFPGERR